jgi:radical SAM superfamily enzyme with C-terminal helix-hairpin-helix motif
MKVAILDGYVDEPSCLGVPPYISPYPRYLAGAIREAGHEYSYLTIDEFRNGSIPKGDILVVIGGAVVPGKYLRGMPISQREVVRIAERFNGIRILGGPTARFGLVDDLGQFDFVSKKDIDTCIFDYLTKNEFTNRNRTLEEWNAWANMGVSIVTSHPDYPQPLMVELDTYRGCVRYKGGGCSFCIEPLYGKPMFREPGDIAEEVRRLSKLGVTNFRLGGQSCMYSYKAIGLGSENPKPNVAEIGELLRGVRNAAPNLKVLHTDNADPAMIADNPEESREVTKLLVENCTSGNVLAFGMESADPGVIEENNLSSEPEQAFKAIRLINELGGARGDNGLPRLLPGLNLLSGLPGESKRTYEKNLGFLKRLLDSNLMVRRINIRQVNPVRLQEPVRKYYREFRRFKEAVRKEVDPEMLRRVVPQGIVLRDVYLEMHEGKTTFGRQVGSYPLLVGLPYKTEINRFVDVHITSHGSRSVTGFEYPMDINRASLDALSSLPSVGLKRARRLALARPFETMKELASALDDPNLAEELSSLVMISEPKE